MSLKYLIKNKDIATCSREKTVADIARIMKEKDIGTMLVQDEDKPIGFITDRDLTLRCLANGEDCFKIKAKDVMTIPVKTINEDANLLNLVEEMSTLKVRRICVVDSSGKAIGIISMADIFELLSYELGQLSNALGKHHQKLFYRNNDSKKVA